MVALRLWMPALLVLTVPLLARGYEAASDEGTPVERLFTKIESPDPLSRMGHIPPHEEEVSTNPWDSRIFTESNFDTGHPDFDLIHNLALDTIKNHLNPISNIPAEQRLKRRTDKNSKPTKLLKMAKVYKRKAESDASEPHDHLLNAGHRLALRLAMSLQEESGGDEGDGEPPCFEEVVKVDEEGEPKAEEAVEEGVLSSMGDGDDDDDTDTVTRPDLSVLQVEKASWKLHTEKIPSTPWEACEKDSSCPFSSSDRSYHCGNYEKVALLKEKHVFRAFHNELRKAYSSECGCTNGPFGKKQKWEPFIFRSNAEVLKSDEAADIVNPVCLSAVASRDKCASFSENEEPRRVCMCFNQNLLYMGWKNAWIGRDDMMNTGLATSLGCDLVLGNKKPTPPPAPSELNSKWHHCGLDSCIIGTGMVCPTKSSSSSFAETSLPTSDELKPLEVGFKTKMTEGPAVDCQCAAGIEPLFQTSYWQHPRHTQLKCLRAVSYNHLCEKMDPADRICMCFDTSLPAEDLAADRAWHDYWLGRAGVRDSRWVSDTLALGCTKWIFKPQDSTIVNTGNWWHNFKREVGATFAKEGKRADSILETGRAIGKNMRFKWDVSLLKLPDFFSQSLGISATCGPAGECLRLMVTMAGQIVALVVNILLDVLSIILIAFKSLLEMFEGGRSFLRGVDNIIEGGKTAVGRLYRKAKVALDAGLDRQGMLSTEEYSRDANESEEELELSRSLVSSAEAERQSRKCQACTGMLAMAVRGPIGPIPNPFSIQAVVKFSKVSQPTMKKLFLSSTTDCAACMEGLKDSLPKPLGGGSRYRTAYAKSCNPISVGLCTVLASQKRLRQDHPDLSELGVKVNSKGWFFQAERGAHIFKEDADGEKFCKRFGEHVFLDLYRSKHPLTGVFSDIQCGTPTGTPTPGMRLKDVCDDVHGLLKDHWKTNPTCWVSETYEPWNYLHECQKLLECSHINTVDNEEEVLAEAAQVSMEKLRNRITEALLETQIKEGNGQEENERQIMALISQITSETQETRDNMNKRMLQAKAEGLWKHDMPLLFGDYRWTRPECLNIRALSEDDMTTFLSRTYGSMKDLYTSMLDVQQRRRRKIQDAGRVLPFTPSYTTSCGDDNPNLFYRYMWCELKGLREKSIRMKMIEKGRESEVTEYFQKEAEKQREGVVAAEKLYEKAERTQV